MPITFHVYENDLTRDYNQEWQLRIAHFAINYYSTTDITVDEARRKMVEITTGMSYIRSVTDTNTMVPRLTYQEDF